MKRIIIIGSAGAGKSTLTRRLSHILNVPIIHLDRYYWQPNWVATPNEEWDQRVIQFTYEDSWIMDGNYSRTLDLRLERADTVIFLDLPRLLCLYRIIKRRLQYNGRTRPDLNEQCPEKLDWAFIGWVWNYKHRSRPHLVKKLDALKSEKQIYWVKTRKEAAQFLERMAREAAE